MAKKIIKKEPLQPKVAINATFLDVFKVIKKDKELRAKSNKKKA